jgi:hypothetical protein
MPKLSAYVSQAGETPLAPAQGGAALQLGTQPGGTAAGREEGQQQARLQQQHAATHLAYQEQQQQQPEHSKQQQLQQQHVGGDGGARAQPELQLEAVGAKLEAEYAKRLREHGPRTFRWPDGSLRPERPPPNPHAVVSGAVPGRTTCWQLSAAAGSCMPVSLGPEHHKYHPCRSRSIHL